MRPHIFGVKFSAESVGTMSSTDSDADVETGSVPKRFKLSNVKAKKHYKVPYQGRCKVADCVMLHSLLGQVESCVKRAKLRMKAAAGVGPPPVVFPMEGPPPPCIVMDLNREEIHESLFAIGSPGWTIVKVCNNVPTEIPAILQKVYDTEVSFGIDNGEGKLVDGATNVPDELQKRRAIALEPHFPGMLPLWIYLKAVITAVGPKVFNYRRNMVGWYLLFSQPGPLQRQIDHKDYNVVLAGGSDDVGETGKPRRRRKGFDTPLDADMMPISVIVSFNNETFWHGPTGEKHQIPSGHLLLFRGDISHSGPACVVSGNPSLRVHSYFDHTTASGAFRFNSTHDKAIFYSRVEKATAKQSCGASVAGLASK